jgi:PAS domain S-box-containing protein
MNATIISGYTPFQEALKRWSRYLIYLVIGLGVFVWLGWKFDIEFLKRPLPHLASMNPTTSVLFILSGFSFLCLLSGNSKKIKFMGYVFTCIIFAIALLRLLDTFTHFQTNIDFFIFSGKLEKDQAGGFSRGMATNTAVCFLLISFALPLVNVETHKKIMPAHFIALLIALFGLLSILGCIYRVQAFYMVLAYIPMAIHTAMGFLFFSLAVLFSNPDKGIMKELTSPYGGSQTARILIPAAILIPMFLGYIRLLAHWSGVFSTEFGEAILILSIIVIFVLLIWYNSVSLNKKDSLRIMAETRLKWNILQLKESEEKFQKAFQVSAAGISITRISDSRYLDVNDTFVQMTGYSKKELIGHSSTELGIVVNLKKREDVLQQVKEQGSAKHFEITVRHKSGRLLEVLSSVETILLNEEKHAINIIFDITDRKEAEMQLEAVNKELEAFSYSVSHDLRAPLRAVDGYAKMLEEDYYDLFDQQGKKFLNSIQYNAKKMSNLIDDLLAFSRLGRKTVLKADLDMNDLIQSVLKDLDKMAKHNAEIKVGELHSANGDYVLMKQVFINLISNGIKYSSKKPDSMIEITSEERDKEIIYSVKDNGDGFDMTYVDKLFGVFQRLHTDEEFEGTGVGLAIVQRIINKHGGKVWAHAELGKGATFSFTLPIK